MKPAAFSSRHRLAVHASRIRLRPGRDRARRQPDPRGRGVERLDGPGAAHGLTVAEHPGTAVEWDGSVYEVRDAIPDADGSIRYRLRPWEDRHTIRRMDFGVELVDALARAVRARSGAGR